VALFLGTSDLVAPLDRLKSNVCSATFRPIKYAAIEALRLPLSWLEQRNALCRRWRGMVVRSCNALGLRCQERKAGLYVWSAIPGGFTSSDFTNWLFDKTGVFITPGTNFGNAGEGYVRIAITAPDERIETALKRMKAAIES